MKIMLIALAMAVKILSKDQNLVYMTFYVWNDSLFKPRYCGM